MRESNTSRRYLRELCGRDDGEIGYVISTGENLDEVRHRLPTGEILSVQAAQPRQLGWTPDGDLCFLSTGPVVTSNGREHELSSGMERPQLWLWKGTSDVIQWTTATSGVLSYDWGPNGDRLIVECILSGERTGSVRTSRIETEQFFHKFSGMGWFESVDRALFVVTESGEMTYVKGTRASAELAPSYGLQPCWGAAGVVFTRNPEPDDAAVRNDILRVDPDEGATDRFTDSGTVFDSPVWAPSGGKVAAVEIDPSHPTEDHTIAVFDSSGERRATVSSDDVFIHGNSLEWGSDDALYLLGGRDGRTHVYETDLDDGTVHVSGTSPRVSESVVDYGTSDARLWWCSSSITGGEALLRRRLGDSPEGETGVERIDTVVGRRRGGSTRRVTWEGRDGTTVSGWLSEPDGTAPYETIVFVHGGPSDYAEPIRTGHVLDWLEAGYAVFQPNYRGSISFGTEFAEDLRGSWNGIEVDDILRGVDHMVERRLSDGERLFPVGFSHGGTVVAYLLAATDRFPAAAASNAIFDFRSAYGSGESPCRFEAEFGVPWRNRDRYDDVSPVNQVEEIDTPLLLLAGARDWHAPFTQADQFFTRLKRCGVDTRLVIDSECAHSLPRDAVAEMEEWFERFGGSRSSSDTYTRRSI